MMGASGSWRLWLLRTQASFYWQPAASALATVFCTVFLEDFFEDKDKVQGLFLLTRMNRGAMGSRQNP